MRWRNDSFLASIPCRLCWRCKRSQIHWTMCMDRSQYSINTYTYTERVTCSIATTKAVDDCSCLDACVSARVLLSMRWAHSSNDHFLTNTESAEIAWIIKTHNICSFLLLFWFTVCKSQSTHPSPFCLFAVVVGAVVVVIRFFWSIYFTRYRLSVFHCVYSILYIFFSLALTCGWLAAIHENNKIHGDINKKKKTSNRFLHMETINMAWTQY